MSDIKNKPHYFELSIRSVSTNEKGEQVLNQECPLVREYANTPAELTMKQMAFVKVAAIPVSQACVDAMDSLSTPLQKMGVEEMAELFKKMQPQSQGTSRKR